MQVRRKVQVEVSFMKMRFEIPDGFWSLFRSVNRETYMEALLAINEEYEYNNYFLTKEACIQVLSDKNAREHFELLREEDENEFDLLETTSSRILNWLLKKGWLKKIEDYSNLVVNIVIPDYAAIFIDAFERLTNEDIEETEVYIQNVYANLYSFKHDPRAGISMLRTTLVNTRRLNKVLQDMLHNMDKFFARLLDQESYGDVLSEHLEGFVEDMVQKKYHILKTSDNFYRYKTDIKNILKEIRDDEQLIEKIRERAKAVKDTKNDVLDLLDMIERGFDDIEHRISNMDREHTKYIRATVTRLNYLLSGQTDTKGLVIQLLNKMSAADDLDNMVLTAGKKMNLSFVEILSEKSLYKRRKGKKDFISHMAKEKIEEDLQREDVLKLNKVQVRFSKKQIEDFIEEHMENEVMDTSNLTIDSDETFEKLILAYDLSTRKKSRYMVIKTQESLIENNGYCYPALQFVKK